MHPGVLPQLRALPRSCGPCTRDQSRNNTSEREQSHWTPGQLKLDGGS